MIGQKKGRSLVRLLGLMMLIIAAGGCAPTATQVPNPTAPLTPFIACDPDDYDDLNFTMISPDDDEVVSSLTPTFTWSYDQFCMPEGIAVEITGRNDWDFYDADLTSNSFTLPAPLDPGERYTWTVYPYRVGDNIQGISETRDFYTEPICDSTALTAPILTDPEQDSWISPPGGYYFRWTYPDSCSPMFYVYEFAQDSGFNNLIESGQTEGPWERARVSIPDCTSAFWRVAAHVGNTTGPYSEARKVTRVSQGSCWQNHVLSIDMAEIYGYVFEDGCNVTGYTQEEVNNAGLTVNPGCVLDDVYRANGTRFAEPLLSGVVVDLGSGPCPSTGLDSTTTNSAGRYRFDVQTPGEYCLSIDGDQMEPTILLGGQGFWTQPFTEEIVVEETINLGAGYTRVRRNFGWDPYDRRPLYPPFTVVMPSFCRAGDSPIYHPLTTFEENQTVETLARNEAGNWLQVQVGDLKCYLSASTGELEYGSINDLPVFDPVPLPTKTPTPRPDRDDSGGEVDCSSFKNKKTCLKQGCNWVDALNQMPYCTD